MKLEMDPAILSTSRKINLAYQKSDNVNILRSCKCKHANN